MARRREKRSCRPVLLEPNAAGIDVGAEEIYVAVPPDRDEESVRRFSSFTCDLHALADWLIECRIRTVAMESTGVYWIPLFPILETRGIEVFLVNAHYLKSVPGRKSDVSDCQWIQYLHSVGLLKASFRPPGDICAIRSLWRHRGSLLQMAAEHIMHIQKSLSQMNLQIHHVLSDITGASGQAILDAILAGERDPMQLAQLCNWRVKSPRAKVAKALEGDYRSEHVFTLKQSLDGYRYYQKLIAELDREIERLMQLLPSGADSSQPIPSRTKHSAFQRQGNDPSFNLRNELYRIAGVDLTDIPGVSAVTAQVVLTEIGTDVSRFRNASAFASWLGLCPEKRVSGGKVLSCKTRKVKNRAALALRLGANSLCRAKGYFGEFFRRMRAKLGTAQAITATAHKIARVLYHVLLTKQPYTETVFHKCDEHARHRAEMRLRNQAAILGFQVVPQIPKPTVSGLVP
jgi:transposase